MPRVLVRNYSISLDGYGAGLSQDLEHPLGVGGGSLHDWIFATRSGRAMIGQEGGSEGIDNDFFNDRAINVGATIMGRNMFGPVRGAWGKSDWTGWWGDDPPFHHPVYVLTNHPRPPLVMQGGTTFYFVQDGIHAALDAAIKTAGERDVLIGGGASTIRQFLGAGLIDEMLVAMVPVLLGDGERLFEGLGSVAENYECVEHVCTPAVTHVRIARTS